MARWRVAASLVALRDQINAAWPGRSTTSDGTIGDAAHQSRDSDHNPWVRDGSIGVVTALDVTHDPAHGCDAGHIAAAIRSSRDRRVKYIIWRRRICNASPTGGAGPWDWRPYGGANPHDKHVHISVKASKSLYDSTEPWAIAATPAIADPVAPEASHRPLLRRGSRGAAVEELQRLLRLDVDGRFGEDTERAVKAFQRKVGLVDDGKVGSKTWAALLV